MATSEVSICNLALMNLGANPIISLSDDTTEAKLSNAFYPAIRDAVLEAHNWTFATKWIELVKLSGAPVGEYSNAFALPVDAARVIFVGESYKHPNMAWRVEGNNIVTDDATCKAQVLCLERDPNKFSANFVQALVARLSAEMAIPLTNSRSLMETHYQIYGQKLKEAVATDNQQGKSRRIRSKWLQQARWSGAVGAGPYV